MFRTSIHGFPPNLSRAYYRAYYYVDIWAYYVEAEDKTTSIASPGRLIVTNTI